MAGLLLGILLLPLAAFAVQIAVGQRLPRKGDWVATGALFLSAALALVVFARVVAQGDPAFREVYRWRWIVLPGLEIPAGILLDRLTALMLVVVAGVAALIHLFSIGYMRGDPLYSRYFAYLALFSFSMLGLVLTDNLLGLYICWELVGLCSYLLIGFWFQKSSAADAGMKAFITTRVGDVGMFIGVLLIYSRLGTFTYDSLFAAVARGDLAGPFLTAAGLCLFMGAVGKSAQFPLHVWLPDAMEGPTPVSALIHAATMVAAGVYMVGRLYLAMTPDALTVIAYVGGITALFAATIALVQVDIKRVLAYSTISQLGYMMLGLGVGGYVAGLFHLMTHAFFKALLFLGSGSVIHALHTQDIREMGGLRGKMPVTTWTFLAGTCALAGVPFLSGFYSKDAILAAVLAFQWGRPGHLLLPLCGFIGAGLTAFYMFRLVFLTFFGAPRDAGRYHHAHESPWVMGIPLVVLAALAVGSGWGGWFLRYLAPPSLEAFGGPAAAGEGAHEGAHAAHALALPLSVVMATLGIVLAYLFYSRGTFSPEAVRRRWPRAHTVLVRKYYMDELYGATVIGGTLLLSRVARWFDNVVIDGLLVNGLARVTTLYSYAQGAFDLRVVDGLVNWLAEGTIASGRRLRRIQTGRIQNYLLWALSLSLAILVLRVF